jgi:hypothetical protein
LSFRTKMNSLNLLSQLFIVNGKIKQIFLHELFNGLTGGKISYYDDSNDSFADSAIITSDTAI